jgi:hypothetical protein
MQVKNEHCQIARQQDDEDDDTGANESDFNEQNDEFDDNGYSNGYRSPEPSSNYKWKNFTVCLKTVVLFFQLEIFLSNRKSLPCIKVPGFCLSGMKLIFNKQSLKNVYPILLTTLGVMSHSILQLQLKRGKNLVVWEVEHWNVGEEGSKFSRMVFIRDIKVEGD